ncbi:MAG: D-alanyl-D-alanine carboxypeptidase/D-alanyl-D-alanine-endopeptidase [Elusimicrobia bacterium]|nr:D-alanyl-D-alanine carboxypeptidase/D-alanyl-D-alanine-endopeptidase [Elusimicrobiota bacterium]
MAAERSPVGRVVFFLLLLQLPARAAIGAGIDARIRKAAASPPLRHAQWGLCVKAVDSGKVVASLDPQANLVPASSLKLFVTAAALATLGGDHRFSTALYHDGRVEKGVLKGNLVIRGGGDPSLGSTLVKGGRPMDAVFADWLQALAAKGIKSVEGDLAADNLLFEGTPIPGSWPWEDAGNYYAAPADALSLGDNLYRLVLAPGAEAGEDAPALRTEPEIKGLAFVNFMKTGPEGSGDNGYIFNIPGSYRAVLRGTVPAGEREFAVKGALPEPALFAAEAFAGFLRRSGVKVSGQARLLARPAAYDESKLVARTDSVPLRDIVRLTNKRSFNLYAEMLARAVAPRFNKPASVLGGNEAVREFLAQAGVDVSSVRLADSCGLSRLNLVSARAVTDLLVHMAKSPQFQDYYDSLAFPADPEGFGHIKNLGTGTVLEKVLRIKSGSLSGVRAYCGYVLARSGRLLAFSFIVNNYTAAPAEVEKVHEDLLLALAQSK